MFVSIYFPVFDNRGFFPQRDQRTRRPIWPVPDIYPNSFQRNLGAIKDRPLGGVTGWAGESSICEIGRSVAFIAQRWQPENRRLSAAYKRFYADGEGAAQFSLGVSVPLSQSSNRQQQSRALNTILSAELKSRHLPHPVAVRDAGGLVTELFAAGTTKGNRLSEAARQVQHGRPLILLQGIGGSDGPGANETGAKRGTSAAWALRDISRSLDLALPGPVIMLDYSARDRCEGRSVRIILARLYLELFVFERCVALATGPRIGQMDEDGRTQLLARLALCAKRLAGSHAPRITRVTDLYGQLGEAFAKVHRPGRIDELAAALRIAGASPNLRRAVVAAATWTGVISADPMAVPTGGIHVTNYINQGQAGAFGENAQASNFTLAWQQQAGKVDLAALAGELGRLQIALHAEANTSDKLAHLTAVAQAKEAAEAGDGPGVLGYLAKTGKWSLSIAEKIGVGLAVAMIKSLIGPTG